MSDLEKRIEEIKQLNASFLKRNMGEKWNTMWDEILQSILNDIPFLLDQLERHRKALDKCKEQRDLIFKLGNFLKSVTQAQTKEWDTALNQILKGDNDNN